MSKGINLGDYEQLKWAVAHDACSPRYRMPCAAVPIGTPMRLQLSVQQHVRELVHSASVMMGAYSADVGAFEWRVISMTECENGFFAEVDFASHPHVVYYAFVLKCVHDGFLYYVPRADSRSTFGELVRNDIDGFWDDQGWHFADYLLPSHDDSTFSLPDPLGGFQITVYDPAFTTPDWLHGAVMYQIFPDRFARGSKGVAAEGIAYHRQMERPVHLHESWDEPVEWEGGSKYDPIDFYAGTLDGVREKLPYLASLGVEALYLNPVFEARSNHRYDTADYMHIDPMLGTDETFEHLVSEARSLGISIVLDAVLSHTGDDSRYFNALDTYDDKGAAEGEDSPYYGWYDFTPMENGVPYKCWWGHPSLPEVNERNAAWQEFVLGSEDGVLSHWLSAGARGYRLDVADEVPDEVLELIRTSVKNANPEAAIIGEVWEDATTKVSYGAPRTYALGNALDSVMNYPLRNALLGFALMSVDALQLSAFLNQQASNYPPAMHACLMNLLGSHDVERMRSVLALGGSFKGETRAEQLSLTESITPEQDSKAARLQRMIVALLYGLPGMPCLYYGDEAGLQGGGDPFCRSTFPWGNSRERRDDCGYDLTEFYQRLGTFRKESSVLRYGKAICVGVNADVLCVIRSFEDERNPMFVVSNRAHEWRTVVVDLMQLPEDVSLRLKAFTGNLNCVFCSAEEGSRGIRACVQDGILQMSIPPCATLYFGK